MQPIYKIYCGSKEHPYAVGTVVTNYFGDIFLTLECPDLKEGFVILPISNDTLSRWKAAKLVQEID